MNEKLERLRAVKRDRKQTESPDWRQSVTDFVLLGFEYGDSLSRDFLLELFGIEPLPNSCSPEDFKKFQLVFLSNMGGFRKALLVEHKIDLRANGGGSYVLVPPRDQTRLAVDDMYSHIAKATRSSLERMLNVNQPLLDDGAKKENMDAIADTTRIIGTILPRRSLSSIKNRLGIAEHVEGAK